MTVEDLEYSLMKTDGKTCVIGEQTDTRLDEPKNVNKRYQKKTTLALFDYVRETEWESTTLCF